jgi:hypothetical protein
MLLLATAYRTLYGVIAGYVVARLAPHRPMRHALIGGAVGLAVCIIGAAVTWNRGLGPHWYSLALIALAMPGLGRRQAPCRTARTKQLMAAKPDLSVKASDPVDSYMRKLKHPPSGCSRSAEANHFERAQRNRRGNQMERSILLLHGSDEAV